MCIQKSTNEAYGVLLIINEIKKMLGNRLHLSAKELKFVKPKDSHHNGYAHFSSFVADFFFRLGRLFSIVVALLRELVVESSRGVTKVNALKHTRFKF